MPNVKFQTHVDKTGELRLGVFVLKRKIKKGEEVNIHNVFDVRFRCLSTDVM